MKFIAFVSAKGGTGRTTLAANLGVILARGPPGARTGL